MPEHGHRNCADAGACLECREWLVAEHGDGPHAFALAYYQPDPSHRTGPGAAVCSCCGEPVSIDLERPDSLAVIRTWSPVREDAVQTAWATGCNPGGGVAVVGPIPAVRFVAARLPLPLFELVEGPDAVTGFRILDAMAHHHP
jgi:hypothetical protein